MNMNVMSELWFRTPISNSALAEITQHIVAFLPLQDTIVRRLICRFSARATLPLPRHPSL